MLISKTTVACNSIYGLHNEPSIFSVKYATLRKFRLEEHNPRLNQSLDIKHIIIIIKFIEVKA